jgi:extracellular solute-binding protein/von Willebrand factor type A domain-containing protein
MPKHVGPDDTVRPLRARGRGRLPVPAWTVALALALIVILGLSTLLVPRQALASLPLAGKVMCTQEPVDVAVSPELQLVVTRILRPVSGQVVEGGRCVEPRVRSQESQVTAASADTLPTDRAPQIWIPDAVVWGEKVQRWPLIPAGSLAGSPVVMATSAQAAEELGWVRKSPTWLQALRGPRPVIVPDYQSQSESLDALIALWQSLGKGAKADQQVVAAVLAAGRSELPGPAAAVADARSGTATAPVFPATEQAVAYLNATADVPHLTAVYPREGSPVLNYPIYRLGGRAQLPAAAAVDLVIRRLRSAGAQEILRQAGFRGPSGAATSAGNPVGTGIRPARAVTVLASPDRAEVDSMIARVQALARPSRILTLMDVSMSMNTKLDPRVTRIQLSATTVRLGINLLPDSGSVGLWVFAGKMGGGKDYRVLRPVQQLSEVNAGGETHRSVLLREVAAVGRHITRGGTSVYDTTIAAMKQMHADYDPKSANAIVLITDGGNSDKSGATLGDLLAQIRILNRGHRKVAIYPAGLGAKADYAAMKQIADASGGHVYRIDTVPAGQQALLDGLRRSRKIS